MECDMISSPYSVLSQRLPPSKESSSDLSYDECSCSPSRNHRKRFWKGNENDIYPSPKIQQSSNEKRMPLRSFTKQKLDTHHCMPYRNGQTIIKLTNVPVKLNNILDLYHSFSPFGTINMIQVDNFQQMYLHNQAQRHSNPFCAIISFQTTEAAFKTIENAKKVILNVNAVWFEDICGINSSNIQDCDYNLENLMEELIEKKKTLLSHQMDSLKKILEKIDKCQSSSEEEIILLRLLKKVQDQINESTKSIEYSIKQKNQYITKQKKQFHMNPIETSQLSGCPPWITAFKNASAKRAENANYEQKRRNNCKPFACSRLLTYRSNSSTRDKDNRSSSASERAFADDTNDSSEESTSERCFFSRLREYRHNQKLCVDMIKDETYECELECLISESTNEMQESD